MIERYGKDFDLKTIDRSLENIRKLVAESKECRSKNLISVSEKQKFDCRICHENKYKDFLTVDGYNYFLCENCDSILLNNLPEVKSLYDEGGVSVDIYTDRKRFNKRIELIAREKVRFIVEAIADEMNTKNNIEKVWCDIGCGVGEVLMMVKQLSDKENLNYKPVGIEADEREIAVGREFGLDIRNEFFDPENISSQVKELLSNANIVSLFNVLEHTINPDKIIECLAKYMKKSSILVVEVPRYPSLASFANLTAPQYIYRHIVPPIHLQIFSEKGMELLLDKDFGIFAKWGFGQGYTDMLTNAMLTGKIEDSILYNDLLNINNIVQKVIDEAGYSDQMIFIAKKV